MELILERDAGHAILAMTEPRLDASSAVGFRAAVDAADLQEGEPLVLDLSSVTFMDSSGVWALTHLCKRSGGSGRLKIVCTTPGVLRLLDFTGVGRFLDVHADRISALTVAETEPAARNPAVFTRILSFFSRPRAGGDSPGHQAA